MSEIRTKILSLSALAMAFAGLSYGQAVNGCATTIPSNIELRAEGETELVSDFVTTGCTVAVAPVTATVVVNLSQAVTSRAETTASSGTFNGNSDAVLTVTQGAVTSYYAGTVNGNSISFTNGSSLISLAVGAVTFQVSNVRVNASAAGTNTQVNETMQISYSNGTNTVVAPFASGTNTEAVGYVAPSLSIAIKQNSNNQNVFYGGTSSSFPTCNGEPLSNTTAPTPAFTLNITELIAGAFRTQSQENGSLVLTSTAGLAATTGAATQGTQLQVAFTNVPSAATIYLPVSITSGGTTLTLQGTGITALTTPASLAGLSGGVFPFTPSSGAVTAIYIVAAPGSTGTVFALPVYMTVAASAAPVQTTAITAAVTYIPTGTVSGPAATIPTFLASTATPLNTLTVTACTTTLLFPFVTNASGFETGIAIANTTTDNLKNETATAQGTSSATPTSGTCLLSFYGNVATQPAGFTTPSIGAYSASPAQAPVYANTLTSMAVPNFTGYAIAYCNFLDAHGFGYIVDNFGQSSGTAEGYLALVMNNSRSGADGSYSVNVTVDTSKSSSQTSNNTVNGGLGN
jgi:hypothetical protein